MSAEPDDRDDPWAEVLDCAACGAENSLIEGWDENGRVTLVCSECGVASVPEAE